MQCSCGGIMVVIRSQSRNNGLWQECRCIRCRISQWFQIYKKKREVSLKFYKAREINPVQKRTYVTEYTIEFPHSQKKWTTDLNKIIDYSQTLKNDCQCIYNVAYLLINDGKTTTKYGLHEWLMQNSNRI